MADRDLTRLSRGEALWAWRTSLGLNQVQAGKRLGLGRHKVSALERGAAWDRSLEPMLRNFTPTLGTMLALARRRAGLGLVGTAAAFGVSAVTLLTWERRGNHCLVAYWRGRGFTFAPKRE